jgi:uncharacterized Zn finger protein
VSVPRRPFGPDQPGRLQATMLKVLAAELSDGGRLARGKRLWADDAVIDLVIGHGAVTARVQGSRPVPYVVTLLTAAGRSVPGRREVTARCTCPDDDTGTALACKHAVAALFALAAEVSLDPDVLDRWRQTDSLPAEPGTPDDAPRTAVRPTTPASSHRASSPADPLAGRIDELLRPPPGSPLPDLPEPAALPAPVAAALPDPLLASVLADALDRLRVRWD